MHGIFVAIGSRGDLYPVLGVGRAMRAAGHDVTVITTGNFEAEVRGAGLDFVEVADADTAARVARSAEAYWARPLLLRRWPAETMDVFRTFRERVVEQVDRLVDDRPTYLAVTIGLDLGAGDIAARRLGLPRVGLWINAEQLALARPRLPDVLRPLPRVAYNAVLRMSPDGRVLRRHDAELRARWGLPRESNLAEAQYDSDLNVGLFPDWYLPHYVRREGALFTGFALYEPSSDMPPALAAFLEAGDPPIAIANASWRTNLDDYYRDAVVAARQLGYRAVCVGPRAPDVSTADQTAITVESVPFEALLPRCAAIVHHGGIGTVARAMAHGTPQLVVPWTVDQPFNARRVRRLGVGLSIRPRAPRRELRVALAEVLGSARIRAANIEGARRLERGPDFRPLTERVETLVSEDRGRLTRLAG